MTCTMCSRFIGFRLISAKFAFDYEPNFRQSTFREMRGILVGHSNSEGAQRLPDGGSEPEAVRSDEQTSLGSKGTVCPPDSVRWRRLIDGDQR